MDLEVDHMISKMFSKLSLPLLQELLLPTHISNMIYRNIGVSLLHHEAICLIILYT